MTDYSKEFIKTLCSKINKTMTEDDIDELFNLYRKSTSEIQDRILCQKKND